MVPGSAAATHQVLFLHACLVELTLPSALYRSMQHFGTSVRYTFTTLYIRAGKLLASDIVAALISGLGAREGCACLHHPRHPGRK